MKKYNHVYDIAFEVISDNEQADDVTPEMLLSALRKRIEQIESNGEVFEACGCPSDTFEEKPNET